MQSKSKTARAALLKAKDAMQDAVEAGCYPVEFELLVNQAFNKMLTFDEQLREPVRNQQLAKEAVEASEANEVPIGSEPVEASEPIQSQTPIAVESVSNVTHITSQAERVEVVAQLTEAPPEEEEVKVPPRDEVLSKALQDVAGDKFDVSNTIPPTYLLTPDLNPLKKVDDTPAVPTGVVNMDYEVGDVEAEVDCVASHFARKIEQVPEEEPLAIEAHTELHEALSVTHPQVQEVTRDEVTKLTKRIESLKNRLAGHYTKSELVNSLRGIRQVVQQANPGVNLDKLAAVSIIDIEGYAENTIKFMQAELNKLKSGSNPK